MLFITSPKGISAGRSERSNLAFSCRLGEPRRSKLFKENKKSQMFRKPLSNGQSKFDFQLNWKANLTSEFSRKLNEKLNHYLTSIMTGNKQLTTGYNQDT